MWSAGAARLEGVVIFPKKLGLLGQSATNPPSAAQACMDAAVSWLGGAP